jgi:hypothetical protein
MFYVAEQALNFDPYDLCLLVARNKGKCHWLLATMILLFLPDK